MHGGLGLPQARSSNGMTIKIIIMKKEGGSKVDPFKPCYMKNTNNSKDVKKHADIRLDKMSP